MGLQAGVLQVVGKGVVEEEGPGDYWVVVVGQGPGALLVPRQMVRVGHLEHEAGQQGVQVQ